MRLKAKLKKKRLNTKLLRNLKSLKFNLEAGHPKESSKTHEADKHGFTVAFKAYELNYSHKGYRPYLFISFLQNKTKYKKLLKNIAKKPAKISTVSIKKIGATMVQDIRAVLRDTQESPVGTTKGRIYGAIDYVFKK